VEISTQGDLQQVGPIGALGSQGVFTKEIQRALLDERIDLAVHSLKDLPTEPVPGLRLAASPLRGPVSDVLVSPQALKWQDLPQGARVGTGSPRRRAQLWHVRPDLRLEDVRGNVDTRLRKLAEGQYDALVLARAGLFRLGLAESMIREFESEILLSAVGQGALGIEIRAADTHTAQIVERLNDPATLASVTAERALLATLRGGCLAPVAAWGRLETAETLRLTAVVLSADGRTRLHADHSGLRHEAAELGTRAAEDLLAQGAAQLIQSARS